MSRLREGFRFNIRSETAVYFVADLFQLDFYNAVMIPKVVIENAVLKGTRHDVLQRVATAYMEGQEYRVFAPARAQGRALDWVEHFAVHTDSTSDFGFGAQAEVSVRDEFGAAVIQAVVEELRREEVEADFWDFGKHPNARFYYAQICLHGHVIAAGGLDKIREEEHCEICGSRCIQRCEKCNAPIRGKRTIQAGKPVVQGIGDYYRVPLFCYNCAAPYPWMQERVETARELIWHDDKLSVEDRESLWGLLQYVMSDPKSGLAPAKRTLIDIKLGKAVAATREFIIDLIAKYTVQMSKP